MLILESKYTIQQIQFQIHQSQLHQMRLGFVGMILEILGINMEIPLMWGEISRQFLVNLFKDLVDQCHHHLITMLQRIQTIEMARKVLQESFLLLAILVQETLIFLILDFVYV